MIISCSRYALLIRACAATVVFGLSGYPASAGAQDAAAPASRPSGGAPSEGADTVELRKRVEAALHVDPYFYDAHVKVSVKDGAVVLSGFVFSDWDMRDAIRIAQKAAGDRRVVNNLSIKAGGRR
jgi:hypothetical protein